MLKHALAAVGLAALVMAPAIAGAAEGPSLPRQEWSFNGIFGTYDRAAMQRGFQVYKEVCSVCHAVKHLHFRDLADLGYTDEEVKQSLPDIRSPIHSPTIRAKCSSGRAGPPTQFRHRFQMTRQHARRITGPSRPICR